MATKLSILLVKLALIVPIKCDGYSYPQPPFQFDDPSPSPPPIYLPPPTPTYLPPPIPPLQDELIPPEDGIVISAPPNQYLPPVKTPLQVLNMSCLDSKDGIGFFRAFLRSNSRGFPVMDSSECALTPTGLDVFRVDLEGQKMTDCGIRTCGVRMCLVLRMATIPGLRLIDDTLVTLQCIPQETVVTHTKHLRLNGQPSEQGRSNSKSISVASGGNQRKFDSVVTLWRKNNGVFDQPVHQGSAVRLGDELMLRTAVREGDGWKSCRLGTVIIRSASSQRSVVLVDEHGCRNPTIRSICPQHPQQTGPLSVQFPFRAFLFQGAAPADDLLLSVRMSACLRPRDCQTRLCEEGTRIRRSTANFSVDWESQIQFRVLPPDSPHSPNGHKWAVLGLGVVVVVLGCGFVGLMVKRV
ncbi:uncharacterized protein LOC655123 [Tribolium castaneum]|uniref:uncharacterized protein LOC655123 n=1 Tax=Tribolium castaneum TaxID=7070 RepID=UPI0030FEE3D8